mmetsp:Transcript_72250/g.211716  ORF Transcript_72250/g.211716 Transcript_72250/m.211716 type:complete len:248 (-) Transcript_72250:204-947(-)
MPSELLVHPAGGDGDAALAPQQGVLLGDGVQPHVQRYHRERVAVGPQEAAVRVVALQDLHELLPRDLLRFALELVRGEAHRHLVVAEQDEELELEDDLLEVAAQLLDVAGVAGQGHAALALAVAAPLPALAELHEARERARGGHDPGVPQAAIQRQPVVWPQLEEAQDEVPGALREPAVGLEAQLPRGLAVGEGVRALQHEVEDNTQAPQIRSLIVSGGTRVCHLRCPELRRANLRQRGTVPIVDEL